MAEARETTPSRNVKDIKERLPSIMGWLSESHTFRMLSEACLGTQNHSRRKIGIIRGPDHAAVDGGLIIDPPAELNFPFHDPAAAWSWARSHENSSVPLQVLRFDAKMGISDWSIDQWAPFFIVTDPRHPEFLCFIPLRSYTSLFNVHRRTHRNDHSHRFLEFRQYNRQSATFDDILAPFAVHQSDIYEAILRLADASIDQKLYVNPTNGVEFHGWSLPPPDTTTHYLLKVNSRDQQTSRDSIEKLASFLDDSTTSFMRLILNPVEPLICDMVLQDQHNSAIYFIEHKARNSDTLSVDLMKIPKEWDEMKSNWHFLLYQRGDELAIHTRRSERSDDFATTPPHLINMASPDSGKEFAKIIRGYGHIAKIRLLNKWQKIDLCDETVQAEQGQSAGASAQADGHQSSRGSLRSGIQKFALEFRDAFNNQCWKLGLHTCILLSNHPCADAVILEHEWTDEDKCAYESSSLLPVSLVSEKASKCVLLRFIPHHPHPSCPSSSRYFELAMQTSFEIPTCTMLDFTYVAMTGGVPVLDQHPSFRKLVLLPSDHTTMLGHSDGCSVCDNMQKKRNWNFIRQSIVAEDLESMLKLSSKKGRQISLAQAPFLETSARPETRIFSFADGAVHSYFSELMTQGSTGQISTVYGPNGLLQAQWNHGDSRQFQQTCPTDKLMQRVLLTLPPGVQCGTSQPLEELDTKTTAIMTERKISRRMAKRYALIEYIEHTGQSMTIKELVAMSGFSSELELRCDHCNTEESCKVLRPDIAYALPREHTHGCVGCYKKRNATCTFKNLPLELIEQLRTFPQFRVLVPCHRCWREGEGCDNSRSTCSCCERAGVTCEREMCACFYEPRDDSFCSLECDKAHCDDNFENIVSTSREEEGTNIQQVTRQLARSKETRVAICTSCWERGWDRICTNEHVCKGCHYRNQNGEDAACQRMRCKRFKTCSGKECKLAHASQGFVSEELVDWDAQERGRRQDVRTLTVRFPIPL